MKLHWSPKSPYVRKVDVAAYELGLTDRIDRVRSPVAMSTVNPEVSADNPLNKIPTLVLDDGQALFDSLVICLHLDSLGEAPRLVPEAGARRWAVLRDHALAQGLTDLLILWRQELERPESAWSPRHLAAFEAKVCATLDRLEQAPPDPQPDLATIATGCALGYADFRFPGLAWRKGRPRLAAWEAEFAERPSMRATRPHD